MIAAVIVAAGRGTRMGPNVDKLFLEVAGLPLVAHTWKRFDQAAEIGHITLVVRDGMQEAFHELAAGLSLTKPYRLVAGGAERQDSVWNGIEAVPPGTEIVAIQDGARPCTSFETIRDTLQAARETGAAVAGFRATDTMKESADGKTIAQHLDRAKLWAVQTPQAFRLDVIRRALTAVREQGLSITDDTAACDLIGQPVRLVESSAPNPKATAKADLPYIELLLSAVGRDSVEP